MMDGGFGSMGLFGGWLGMIVYPAIIIGIIILIVWAIQSAAGGGGNRNSRNVLEG